MTEIQVDAILAQHRNVLNRYSQAVNEYKALTRILGGLSHHEQIAVAAIHAQSYENADMPRGGGLSDPTARIGMAFAEGKEPKYVTELKDDIEKLRMKITVLQRNVDMVGRWMQALNDREKFVVMVRVVDGLTWFETVKVFEGRFGYGYSKSGLKRVLARGMSKIYDAAMYS